MFASGDNDEEPAHLARYSDRGATFWARAIARVGMTTVLLGILSIADATTKGDRVPPDSATAYIQGNPVMRRDRSRLKRVAIFPIFFPRFSL